MIPGFKVSKETHVTNESQKWCGPRRKKEKNPLLKEEEEEAFGDRRGSLYNFLCARTINARLQARLFVSKVVVARKKKKKTRKIEVRRSASQRAETV